MLTDADVAEGRSRKANPQTPVTVRPYSRMTVNVNGEACSRCDH